MISAMLRRACHSIKRIEPQRMQTSGPQQSFLRTVNKIKYFGTPKGLRNLYKMMRGAQNLQASDAIMPPKPFDNSFLIYQDYNSKHKQRGDLLKASIALAGFYTLASPQPFSGLLLFAGILFYSQSARIIQSGRRQVVRMDLLPHLNSVLIEKMILGRKVRNIVPVEQIIHVIYDPQNDGHYTSHNYLQTECNLVFRNKITKELYFFGKSGVWYDIPQQAKQILKIDPIKEVF